jgi:hypothetical protein
LDWAGELDAVMSCDFLSKWTTLEKLQKSKPEAVRKFYQEHGCRRGNVIDKRLKQIHSALPLTTDEAVIQTSVIMVKTIAPQLRSLIVAIAHFDRRIKQAFQKHPDTQIFSSLPGAGSVMAPRLLVAMGSDRSRFNSSAEVAEYSGIAPVTERSGKAKWVHRRFACSQFVKQSFHEFAGQSIMHCDWARAYYDQKKAEGKEHQVAIRALAYRWIRIIYRCWKDRVPYNEQTYMEALQRKRPSWLASGADWEFLNAQSGPRSKNHVSSSLSVAQKKIIFWRSTDFDFRARIVPLRICLANRLTVSDRRSSGRCALARQRILRCRPVRGLFYKTCVDQSQRVRLTPTNDNVDLDYGVWIVLHWKAWPPMYVITSGQDTVRAVIMRHACWVATLKYRTDNLRCLSAP